MIPVYMERHGNRWTPDRQRHYWRQSSEAEAAEHPYISIRPRGRHARVVCDWITAGRRPPDLFARMVADHLAICWPEARIKGVGSYTVIRCVPLSQAAQVAEDIAALVRLAMRTVHCPEASAAGFDDAGGWRP
jgi:hypothetical protein